MRDELAPVLRASASVSAIVPARNEAAVVGRALESLSRQQFSGRLQIVVVDDDSEDATAEIALRYATVIRGTSLAEGWTGKLWALSQGIAHGGAPDYFLLTDADVVHAPENLAGLVARAEGEGYDLVSYMAELRCQSLAERALIPAFVFFFFLLYPPAWIRDPRRATAGAAGGCILIRREMLERIGGIASIRSELIDDCALARAVKRAGGRVWLGPSRSVESIREYGTFGEVARMISRTAFTQLRYSTAILAGGGGACLRLPAAACAGSRGKSLWRRGVADDVLRVFAGGSLLPPKPAVGASAARHCGLLYGMHGGVGDTVLARCWGKLEGTSAGGAIAQ